jgi:serine/threonine protein kinase
LLDDNGYSKLVDFWSLGVLLFEMCCGWSPFYAEDTQQMYKVRPSVGRRRRYWSQMG